MWIVVMFDLPVGTREQRKVAVKFRKDLTDLGFEMTQRSVYSRMTRTERHADRLIVQVERRLPSEGEVRILPLTDQHYAGTRCFVDGARCHVGGPGSLILI